MPIEWIQGLLGGLMIGCAGAAYLLLNGRVMGASGIIGGIVDGSGRSNFAERLAFTLGLILLPAGLAMARGGAETYASGNLTLLGIAGLLVGLGTRLANGCTSGHGVCGLSRFSLRGLVATLCYIGAGAVSILALRHGLGLL